MPKQGSNGDGPLPTICGQALIGRSIEDIAVGKKAGSLKRKRRLIEMTCVDGAVIFDDNHLLAVGALVRSHPSVGNQLVPGPMPPDPHTSGCAHPIKVSSDGDVTVYFAAATKTGSATLSCTSFDAGGSVFEVRATFCLRRRRGRPTTP